MKSCGQSVVGSDEKQFALYVDLIAEETAELTDAIAANDQVEVLDALIDIITVSIGALHSLGVDAEGAWNEVVRSNLSKIDKETGMVIRREDGKILKPSSYSPPNLTTFINR
jgi:predicted HAD superfamily Cof-like phosphohydrolase